MTDEAIKRLEEIKKSGYVGNWAIDWLISALEAEAKEVKRLTSELQLVIAPQPEREKALRAARDKLAQRAKEDEMTDFYAKIEPGIRIWVKRLRDAGINTYISCGHQGYIYCECSDLSRELECIKKVLHSNDLWHYEIRFIRSSNGPAHTDWTETIEIRSKAFVADLEAAETERDKLATALQPYVREHAKAFGPGLCCECAYCKEARAALEEKP